MILQDVEHGSAYVWLFLHLMGAGVMLYAWRRYRQAFWVWSAAKWTAQGIAGVARDFLPIGAPLEFGLIAIRVIVTVTGGVAVYYVLRMVHRRRMVSVVAETSEGLIVRDGMDNYLVPLRPKDRRAELNGAAPLDVPDAVDTPPARSREDG